MITMLGNGPYYKRFFFLKLAFTKNKQSIINSVIYATSYFTLLQQNMFNVEIDFFKRSC